MDPFNDELEHLVRIATRLTYDTDHSHKEWKRLVWEKANALEAECPAIYAGLPAALTKAMQNDSPESGPDQSSTNE